MLDKAVIWLSFLIAIIGNFIISLGMIPFLISLDKLKLYFIVIIVGLSFGLLCELLIRSIWHFETKHHILFLTVIPLIAVVSFTLIPAVSSELNSLSGAQYFQIKQNPVFVGIAYAVAFILPYLTYQFFLKNK